MRTLKNNNTGSIHPVAVFFICLGLASFLTLLFGEILEPFFNIMPSGYIKTALLMIFPNGLLLVVILILIFTMLMTYQKRRYMQGGS